MTGQGPDGETWRLRAWIDDGDTCIKFSRVTPVLRSGGAGARCGYVAPMDAGGVGNSVSQYVLGTVTPDEARTVVARTLDGGEHLGELYGPVSEFGASFFVIPVPPELEWSAVAAFDSSGTEVASKIRRRT